MPSDAINVQKGISHVRLDTCARTLFDGSEPSLNG